MEDSWLDEPEDENLQFHMLSSDDVEAMLGDRLSSHTKAVISGGKKLFLDYLRVMKQDLSQVNQDNADEIICGFFLSIRKKDGTVYKTKSLESIQYGVKYFLKQEKNIDNRGQEKVPKDRAFLCRCSRHSLNN